MFYENAKNHTNSLSKLVRDYFLMRSKTLPFVLEKMSAKNRRHPSMKLRMEKLKQELQVQKNQKAKDFIQKHGIPVKQVKADGPNMKRKLRNPQKKGYATSSESSDASSSLSKTAKKGDHVKLAVKEKKIKSPNPCEKTRDHYTEEMVKRSELRNDKMKSKVTKIENILKIKKNSSDIIKDKSSINSIKKRMTKLREALQTEEITKTPPKNKPYAPSTVSSPVPVATDERQKKVTRPSGDQPQKNTTPDFPLNKILNNYKIPKTKTKEPSVDLPVAKANDDEEEMEVDTENEASDEMDWEELRRDVDDTKEPSFYPGAAQKVGVASSVENQEFSQWIIIIDTNIYISNLPMVEKVFNFPLSGCGFPVLFIPHRVLCELDSLKDAQNRTKDISGSAQKAVKYLNTLLRERHPRIQGEKFETYLANNNPSLTADDKILLSCINLKRTQPNKRLIILSNDVNLRNKAIVDDMETFSAIEFEDKILNNPNEIEYSAGDKTQLLLHAKNLLRSILEQILCAECRYARKFSTLEETVDYFVKRWPQRFSSNYPVPAEESLKKLMSLLQQNAGNCELLVDLIEVSKTFLSHFYVKGRPYFENINKTLSTFEEIAAVAISSKDPVGDLRALFSNCWTALNGEILRLRTEGGVSDSVLIALKRIINALVGVLKDPTSHCSSSPALKELSSTLADYSNQPLGYYSSLLKIAVSQKEGIELLQEVSNFFQQSLQNVISF